MLRKKRLIVPFVLLLGILGCSQSDNAGKTEDKQTKEPAKTELVVSAAASLTDSLQEIKKSFELQNGSIQLTFNFGSSGALQQQIEQGAPADLFFSAGKKQMTTLVEKKLVDENAQKNLLSNALVLIIPSDAKAVPAAVNDLTKPEYKKVATGEPETVPVGGYAKDALIYAKLWDELQPKLVLAKDVRQVLTYVETGNADAGFVYRTDALTSSKVKEAFAVDPKSYKTIEYPVGIVKSTGHAKEAQAFYDYLQSEAALGIFVKYGFTVYK
ncbi:molybdate ABC transporter substrate-binding protein [Paenibacillus contaminans]|uniref:Molybdate ABC transporter substrate-binding protein n=1 Tax=Paenibacillus contaminans TaxID=450362 RepID=A0A329LKH9_9BACL|nr:molybdate ABC transporter substrate-binding protein [Paenibacillus contaminans]RAV08464.1 molybdate ABC transporter substrate-binding protein [Paenibacillus contaminans]